ncbi:glycosyltransferase [Synechocystis sp. LKSZ1]|uniref:CgeB family protein n=1 Tax=Synechocystis sp. LKSZ1 TaxID=3144951 RepID=UPI00336BCA62
MRLLRITTNYPNYLSQFYTKKSELKNKLFSIQYQKITDDCFGWADFWSKALEHHGYDVTEIISNAKYMQFAWARENQIAINSVNWLEEITLRQIQSVAPEILFVDDHSTFTPKFINHVREQCPSIRLILGWCGSPIHNYSVFNSYDIILSNIPELVTEFQKLGHKSYHVNHAFEPRILDKINKLVAQDIDFSFIGSIVKASNYHIEREVFLEKLVNQTNLEIWSDVSSSSLLNQKLLPIKQFVHDCIQPCKKNPFLSKIILKLPKLKNFIKLSDRPSNKDFISRSIVLRSHNPVYGLEMYQQLAKSKLAFNNHINISLQSASNMRLFEATGVGTCLITDWKDNLTELFESDREVVTYRNVEECIEKVKWLLENDDARQAIAEAGQKRTLKDHTFSQRAIQLDEIIRKSL